MELDDLPKEKLKELIHEVVPFLLQLTHYIVLIFETFFLFSQFKLPLPGN